MATIPGAPAPPPDEPATPRLASQRFAPSGASRGRLALVHGFTQTSACWSPVDEDLASDHDLVLVDAPGHGASASVHVDLWSGGQTLTETCGEATYIGYSMGGRFCLHAALARPDAVERLVLVSATAGIDDPGRRAERRAADEALATHLVEIGVERFVDEWLARPMFAGLGPGQAHRRARLANTPDGLASSLRRAGTGTQEPLWDRLGELTMPVLVMAGALDATYVAVAERLAAGIGSGAELVLIGDAGHTAHLEQPAAFLAALRPWLARTHAP